MNTWIVGRRPIGFLEYDSENTPDSVLSKVFFLKGHIFAGQVKAEGSSIVDFAWLTKEEIESRVAKEYWVGTKDMLSDF